MNSTAQPEATLPGDAASQPVMSRRLLWLLWALVVALFISDCLAPISSRETRWGGVVLLGGGWFGFILLTWRRRRLRFSLLGLTGLAACFLVAPAPARLSSSALRQDFLAGLQRYEGVTYYWGGESFKGIDCSGLVRRGLVDAAFCRGLQSLNPGLVRYALWVWWHDCTAGDLGEGYREMTVHVLDTPSLNQLDHSRLLPGDLAVTAGGGHIMAYLGGRKWIEADPGAGRVITVSAPCTTNAWFVEPMKIMRWSILQP